MSDYTPTTSAIRCVATNWDVKTKKKKFDRWLVEVKAQERERIIALLEAEFYEDDVNMNTMLVNYGLVIAFIKGEEQ